MICTKIKVEAEGRNLILKLLGACNLIGRKKNCDRKKESLGGNSSVTLGRVG